MTTEQQSAVFQRIGDLQQQLVDVVAVVRQQAQPFPERMKLDPYRVIQAPVLEALYRAANELVEGLQVLEALVDRAETPGARSH